MDKFEFDRFTIEGHEFVAYRADDDTGEKPWTCEDGHGPVSDWRPKDSKRPGEMVLCSDRGQCQFYDFQAAVKLALKDGWDTSPYKQGKPGERAQRAALADYKRLRDFCAGHWGYIGVIVKGAGGEDSLWGIESDSEDYQKETAREMAQGLILEAKERQRKAEVKQAFVGCECV